MRKPKKFFDENIKRQAVGDYVSGKKSAQEVADGLGIERGMIYKWRVQLDDRAKGERIEELEGQGYSREQAHQIERQAAEIEAYKQTVAKQSVIIDLLKKLQTSTHSHIENELTGLIELTKKLDLKKKPQK